MDPGFLVEPTLHNDKKRGNHSLEFSGLERSIVGQVLAQTWLVSSNLLA